MRAVKRWTARSGRCRGPYTVKNRRQAMRVAYRCEKARHTSSPPRLLAAYGEIGWSARASYENGAGVDSPYTEEDDPNTTRVIPSWRAESSNRAVAVTFASMYAAGCCSEV